MELSGSLLIWVAPTPMPPLTFFICFAERVLRAIFFVDFIATSIYACAFSRQFAWLFPSKSLQRSNSGEQATGQPRRALDAGPRRRSGWPDALRRSNPLPLASNQGLGVRRADRRTPYEEAAFDLFHLLCGQSFAGNFFLRLHSYLHFRLRVLSSVCIALPEQIATNPSMVEFRRSHRRPAAPGLERRLPPTDRLARFLRRLTLSVGLQYAVGLVVDVLAREMLPPLTFFICLAERVLWTFFFIGFIAISFCACALYPQFLSL